MHYVNQRKPSPNFPPPISFRMLIQVGSTRTSFVLFVAFTVTLCCRHGIAEKAAATATTALHQKIDATIDSVQIGPHSAVSSDEEFCRRIHLDLIGRIPSAEETKSFVDETSDGKRMSLVDRLLKSDECDRFLAETFDIMLMERRKDQHVTSLEWRTFLTESFAANKPYNQLAREILSADGSDGKMRPAAKFYLDRQMESHSVTQDVSRMFLGRDIECAQCHDHPLYGDYMQSEYYGIFSLVNRSYLFTDDKAKKSYLGEKAEGEAEYSSVFEPDAVKVVALPKVVGGLALDREPIHRDDDAYKVKPAKGVRSVPRFSRRESLARFVTDDSNIAFRQNIANRLWAHMMGRGLVEPVDLHQSDNQPSNSTLLSLLADAFLSVNYDTKEMLRQIAFSKTYQRTIDIPAPIFDAASIRAALDDCKAAHDEQELVCDSLVLEVDGASEMLDQRRQKVRANVDEVEKLKKQIAEHQKAVESHKKKIVDIQKQHDVKSKLFDSINSSLEQAKKAQKDLKNDKGLAKALKQIEGNSQEVANQVAALAKRLKAEKAKADETSAKIKPLKLSVEKLNTDRTFLADKVAESRGVHRFFSKKLNAQMVTLQDLQRRISTMEQSIEFHDFGKQYQLGREQLVALQERVASQSKDLQIRRELVADLESQLVTKESNDKTLSESLRSVTEQDRSVAALVDTLEEAVNQTESAIAQLAGDEGLNSAVETIRRRLQVAIDEHSGLKTNMKQILGERDSNSKAIESLTKRLSEATTQFREASKELERLESKIQAKQEEVQLAESRRDLAFDEMTNGWTNRFAVRPLAPLRPEQLARSVVIALGMDHRFRQEAESEWQNKNKEKKPEEIDADKKRAEINTLFEKRVKNTEDLFVRLFAAAPGSPQDVFQSSVDQALFLGNDNKVKGWLSARDGSLVKRLRNEKDSGQFAKTLYLSVLSRHPSDMEKRDVTEYLAARPKERNSAIDELVWGLITSLEFRFNH